MSRSASAHRLTFDLRMVAAITLSAGGIAGAQWASLSGLKSEIRNVNTLLEERARADERVAEAQRQRDQDRAKLEEDRAIQLRESIQAMRNRQEMQQLEIQDLKETILRNGQSLNRR